MSTRTAQVEANIARVLSGVIHDMRDPRLPLVVTVEAVRVTADLGYARVFISSLGNNTEVLAALEHGKGFLQRQLAQELPMRRTPLLSFHDASETLS
jgi:ribosome-binding factor A